MHELKEGRHNHFLNLPCICARFYHRRIVAPAFRCRPSTPRLILGLNYCAGWCTVGDFADFVARCQRCVIVWRK
jgi:hypothetical protein